MSIIDEVKQRLDIVEVVSRYVSLQKAGRNYKACCPFHQERTPSFIVTPERQTWHCFGACATGGDLFAFVMKKENLDFGEALRLLAQQAGVQLEEKAGGQKERLFQINQAAASYFHRLLLSSQGQEALDYLKKRGLNQQAIEDFQLGRSARGEELKSHLLKGGYPAEELLTAGLLVQGDGGDLRDRFRHRIMYPIWGASGQVCGFGGRAMGDNMPKYLNSPQTPVFEKGSILYALNKAKNAIRQTGEVVIVEGYMDAIAAHQYGYQNVVASMGTSLTQSQVSLLRGLGQSFVLALDPDVAGQEATLRSLESAWNVFQRNVVAKPRGVSMFDARGQASLRIARLPAGQDPDEYLQHSPEEWPELIKQAVPLVDYVMQAIAARLDLNTPAGKAQCVEAVFPLIAATDNPYLQDQAFHKLAGLLGVDEATLKAGIGRPRAGKEPKGTPRKAEVSTSALTSAQGDPLEEYFLSLLLRFPQKKIETEAISPEHFLRGENREIFTSWSKSSTIEELEGKLDRNLVEHAQRLLNREIPPATGKEMEQAFLDCLHRLEERRLRDVEQALTAEVLEADESTREQLIQVNRRLTQIFGSRSASKQGEGDER